MSKSPNLYLPATIETTVGSLDVRLFGLARVGSDGAYFEIGSVPSAPSSLLPANLTTSIPRPLALPGVTFTNLMLTGSITKAGDQTHTQLAIAASTHFDALLLTLSAAIVIDDGVGRLALITLEAGQPLTLTHILQSLIGGGADWLSAVTDEFAFISGSLSMLSPPEKAPADYAYLYTDSSGRQSRFYPGFRAEGIFQLFGASDFRVMLGVGEAVDRQAFDLPTTYTPAKTDVTVTTASPASLKFDFIELRAAKLRIARLGGHSIMQVSSTVVLFSTELPIALLVGYDAAVAGLSGSISAPLSGGRELTLGLRWTKTNGVQLVSIDGLGDQVMPLLKEFEHILNELQGAGCEKIVGDWLNGAARSTIKPSLTGSLQNSGSEVLVPLQLTYTLIFDEAKLIALDIPLPLTLTKPRSLDDLPSAIWSSITDSGSSIAEAVLADGEAYAALAIAVGKKVGAAAFARFICRALLRALEELAKTIARAAEVLVTDAIGAVAELAGMLVAVALLGVNVVLKLFEEIWDEIKSWFGAGDSKKHEAEQKILGIRAQVEQTLADVDSKIASAREHMAIASLDLSLGGPDEALVVNAQVAWRGGFAPSTDSNNRLKVLVEFLTGHPGDRDGTLLDQRDLAGTVPPAAPRLSALAASSGPGGYGMNARVTPSISGFVFMNSATAVRIQSAIDSLRGLDNHVADDFANYLALRKKEYQDHNRNGISGTPVYASSDTPYTTQIDVSRLGANSRLP